MNTVTCVVAVEGAFETPSCMVQLWLRPDRLCVRQRTDQMCPHMFPFATQLPSQFDGNPTYRMRPSTGTPGLI